MTKTGIFLEESAMTDVHLFIFFFDYFATYIFIDYFLLKFTSICHNGNDIILSSLHVVSVT